MNNQQNTLSVIDPEWTVDRCKTFTTEHGLTTAPTNSVGFAFICPACETANALKGDPTEFRNRFVRCMRCTHVVLLDTTALDHFVAEGCDNV